MVGIHRLYMYIYTYMHIYIYIYIYRVPLTRDQSWAPNVILDQFFKDKGKTKQTQIPLVFYKHLYEFKLASIYKKQPQHYPNTAHSNVTSHSFHCDVTLIPL